MKIIPGVIAKVMQISTQIIRQLLVQIGTLHHLLDIN